MVDLWDLLPGDDLGVFMEQGIAAADCVIVVCTKGYRDKAERRSGGVGRESTILSVEAYGKVPARRLVPVLREDFQAAWPSFLGDRAYIDFRSESEFPPKCEELAKAIHGIPRFRKPPLGQSPFTYGIDE
jgi:hypothetical protein